MKRFSLLIIALLSFSFCFSQKTKVEIKRTDMMKGDKEVRKLYGNVLFQHNDAYMYCDSAISYAKDNRFEAYGHVRIVNKDVTVYGDTLYYSSSQSMASLRGDIRMIHGKMTLTTHFLDYDLKENMGYYRGGGKIIDETNILTSKIGRYYVDDAMLFFKNDVVLKNPNYVMNTDTLKYKTGINVAYFVGPTDVTSQENVIHTENGWYNTKADLAQLYKNSYLHKGSHYVYGDDMFYDRKKDEGTIRKNAVIKDTSAKITLYSQYGFYEGKKKSVFVTNKVLAVKAFKTDSLYLHADSLFLNQYTVARKDSVKTDSVTYEVVTAYHKVRFYKSDIQGVCDSVVYNALDSMIYLRSNPIIWSDENQVTGLDIRLKLAEKNTRLDQIIIQSDAFVVEQCDHDKFNQMKGKSLIGYLKNNEIYRLDIFQNGETLYYMKDGDDFVGVNKAVCSDISVYLKHGKIDQIVFKNKPEGTFSPVEQFPKKMAKFDKFQWYDTVRPVDAKDVFNWRK
jgi:lipopolysaccharide export system protein LptA